VRKFLTCFSLTISLFAATGTITFTPPAPGKVVAIAGSVTCTVSGNTVPATAVNVSCIMGSVTIPSYIVPLPANSAYSFTEILNGDAITFTLSSNASGVIAWQAAATPNGGTASTSNGNF
jgi:hypothetical protein